MPKLREGCRQENSDLDKCADMCRGLFDITKNAIALYLAIDDGDDFVLADINRAGEKIEKVKREEVTGKRITIVFPGVKEFGLLNVMQKVWQTGQSHHCPISYYSDSRISGWRKNSVYRLPTNEIAVVYSDETDHRTAEIALKESEERFRQLTENIQEVFWIISSDWQRIEYISPAFDRVWGFSRYEVYERTEALFESIVEKDRSGLEDFFSIDSNRDKSEIVFPEHSIQRPDGTLRWISTRGYPVRNEAGEICKIVGISEDITESKHSEKAFHAILEGTAGAIGQSFFDRLVHELATWLDCDIALVGEIHGVSKIKVLSLIMNGAVTRDEIYDIEGTPSEGVLKNGFTVHHDDVNNLFPQDEQLRKTGACGYVGTPLKDLQGKSIGVLIAMNRKRLTLPERANEVMSILAARASAEIERKKIGEEKKKMEAQLRQAQKMEAIGTLAGGIAHDFNNILQSIILNTELSIFETASSDVKPYRMEEVLKASKRATDLVKQILTFSRQSEQELKPLNIGLVIKEVLKMLRSSLPSTIEIISDVSSSIDPVMADPTQIHQVVMNLCTNAAHAMKERGGTLMITLHHCELPDETSLLHPDLIPGPYMKIAISDTGCGMEGVILERIFDPFFTTKERGEGAGLGLAVVYGIVKELKGSITVESEPGKGSKFTILIPRIKKMLRDSAEEIRPIPVGTETILIVDDEDALIDIQKNFFERLGYRVITRSNSIEALQEFMKDPEKIDIIITDQTMPKMTGMQLARECMSIRPDIPVILCTGFSELVSEEAAKSAGIREFAFKPLVIREIAEKVRSILDSDNDKVLS